MSLSRPIVDPSQTSSRRTRRRRLLPAASIVAVAVAVFVAVWFQPQKLLIDETVSEDVPVASESRAFGDPEQAGTSENPSVATADPTVLATGEFVSLDHGTTGQVRVLAIGGQRFVRLEDLDTSNGPDLYLYLTTNAADGDEGAFDDDVVNLGRLKGNRGDQNYRLPTDVDLRRFRSVVVWCDRFNSAFGAAELAAT